MVNTQRTTKASFHQALYLVTKAFNIQCNGLCGVKIHSEKNPTIYLRTPVIITSTYEKACKPGPSCSKVG